MDYSFEHEAYLKGYTAVCGIDEAGRGPLAGPVYAAAVWLPEGLVIDGLNDSKKLSEKKREALFDVIKENAVAYGIGFADEKEIDEINILQATYLAMRRAYDNMQKACDYVLIDGNRMPPMPVPGEIIVKGDAKSPSIAAASILAKVSRDRVMLEYAKQYPGYHF
ncbi:ribonuclease HII, partial [Hominenteromicrobium sp.]|uniref:ribonuclease HII n=1 Tax=Hominenteromicrobium sp. TaxID=3073581 RepID=UPI003AB34424